MTSVPPLDIKNGGFSITSCPILRIKSAASIARCTKSPADSAAQPIKSGCLSSTTPLPNWVVTKGIPVLSMNSVNIFDVIFRLPPAPIIMIGDLAAWIFCSARSIAFSSAIGRRTTEAGIGRSSVCSSAMSSGSSICTAPGFSSSAIR